MRIDDKNIKVDSEGYLLNPSQWDKTVATKLANGEGLKLTTDYWAVFEFMRSYYYKHGVAPDIHHTTKHIIHNFGIDKKAAKAKLFKMFPYGYVNQAYKTSGIKQPKGWNISN